MNSKIELLAPAGSREAFVAALENGADAVYLAGKMFGARHFAPNFTDEELADIIGQAHLRGVKIYITVNTLVGNDELPPLADYLQTLYVIGADGIIVQDLGVAHLARSIVPKLPLHASTQMTVHNLSGVKLLGEHGFKRVVLAREVSLADITRITTGTTVEIEVFGHGALCVCYSGQCLMSSMIGGRSGNRGKCAQPCRLPYTLVSADGQPVQGQWGTYLLSPKDLNTITLLPQLVQAGITSLKIEGRMKRPEYVATVIRIYREAIDRYYADPEHYQVTAEQQRSLRQIFNRGFTTGYLEKKQQRELISDLRPNNRGVYIGRVTAYQAKERLVGIKLEQQLAVGDGVEFWVKVGGRVGTEISKILINQQAVQMADSGQIAFIPVPAPVKVGDRVFKTSDAALMEMAKYSFSQGAPLRRISLKMKVSVAEGEPLTIEVIDQDGFNGVGCSEFLAEPARNRPLNEETIRKQVERLGTTVFELAELELDIRGQLMVPVSEINHARRQAIEQLEQARTACYQRHLNRDVCRVRVHDLLSNPVTFERYVRKPALVVNVDDVEKCRAAVDHGADIVLFGGETFNGDPLTITDYEQAVNYCKQQHCRILLNTPRICQEQQVAAVSTLMDQFHQLGIDTVAVGNLGILREAVQRGFRIHADFPLNVFNQLAIAQLQEWGASSVTLSPELTFQQIQELVRVIDVQVECLVQGRMELMISEYCVSGSFLGNSTGSACSRVCQRSKFALQDRMGELFPLMTDQYCRMHLLNAKELSMWEYVPRFAEIGIDRVRIEAKYETVGKTAYWTQRYRQMLDRKGSLHGEWNKHQPGDDGITRGHYFRGV